MMRSIHHNYHKHAYNKKKSVQQEMLAENATR